ncbi:hypothetical protein QAD02_001565, partial [Eretmocerus hayati]
FHRNVGLVVNVRKDIIVNVRMRQRLRSSLPCLLAIIVFSGTCESIFFGGPRAIWSLIQTFSAHKYPKPVHHYHMHYYPVPVPPPPPPPPPPKIEIALSSLHNHHVPSFGSWSHDSFSSPHVDLSHYGSAYPETGWPSEHQGWQDSAGLYSEQHRSWALPENNEIGDKDPAYKEAKSSGILLQVPLKQQIVLYQPPAKDTKPSLLTLFIKKLRRLNDALLHPEVEETTEKHDDKPHVTNSLTYA